MIANSAKKTKSNKKNTVWKKILIFLAFEFVFTSLTMPLMVFYGPFNNVKKTVVGTFWSTWKHRYLATAFLREDVIEKMLGYNYEADAAIDEPFEMPDIQINHTGNIEVANIEGNGISAKLITISDPTRVVVGISSLIPKSGETTSTIAKKNKAVAAINAGGFIDVGWAGTGGAPDGFIIHDGKVQYDSRGPGAEDDAIDSVAITKKGVLIVGQHSINDLMKYGVTEGVSFGPPLIVKGKRTYPEYAGVAPRTAIAQKATGEIMFLVADGRNLQTLGATYEDLQNILLEFGAVNAANLDGGSSTTMFYNGKVINKPSEPMGERMVASVFMVMPEGGSR